MQVIDTLSDFNKQNFAVVTIGTFDGVHIGHQAILKELVADANQQSGASILITFWPHPRFVLKKGKTDLRLLSTLEEKTNLLASLGLDYLVKIPFTPEFSNLSGEEFIKQVLVDAVGTRKLYIGYDHRFGNDRGGSLTMLEERATHYNYQVEEIPRQDIESIGVSSTKIREALHCGDIQLANSLLGRKYEISGKVVVGRKIGREIDFPTANISIEEEYKLLPSDGAYAVLVDVADDQYKGMMNIGFKPTIGGNERTIEVHIFNFEEDIYHKDITIRFVEALRKEMKFESIAGLKSQLQLDKELALNILL